MNKAIILLALLVIVLAYADASRKRPNPQRPDCLKLKCESRSKKLLCVRSKKNNCRLLTICQVSRVNCQRGPLNVLNRTSRRQCAGIRPGQKRKCRPAPSKRG